jgi:hypothetical protein
VNDLLAGIKESLDKRSNVLNEIFIDDWRGLKLIEKDLS